MRQRGHGIVQPDIVERADIASSWILCQVQWGEADNRLDVVQVDREQKRVPVTLHRTADIQLYVQPARQYSRA
jgi:hypothetical protein